jgi:hypothetical protein
MTDGFKYIVRGLAAFDGWGFFYCVAYIRSLFFIFYFLRRERRGRDEIDV